MFVFQVLRTHYLQCCFFLGNRQLSTALSPPVPTQAMEGRNPPSHSMALLGAWLSRQVLCEDFGRWWACVPWAQGGPPSRIRTSWGAFAPHASQAVPLSLGWQSPRHVFHC